jgi:hypothetical protein
MASSRIAIASSSSRTIPGSPRSSGMWSGFPSIHRLMPSCSPWTRRARFRRSTAPSIDQRDAAQSLQGLNNRTQAPIRQKQLDLLLNPLEPPFRIADGIDIILKGDLLGGMIEGEC